MKDLTNMISGIMRSQNAVTELTTRINETKTNPKFAKNCDISLFIIKSLAYTIIESFHFPEKNIYRCKSIQYHYYQYTFPFVWNHVYYFFDSDCWTSLIQSRYTIWPDITLLVAIANLEIIFSFIILIYKYNRQNQIW